MADKIHKLKLKMGEIEIELEGDKKFVKEYFNEVKGLISIAEGKTLPKVEIPIVSPETQEAPKKRRRGRPRKTEVTKVVEEPPKKRKRGRPRKTEVKSSEVTVEKQKIDLKSLSLPEMFKVKKPTKEEDKILLMAFYLNKVKRKREFRAKDIEELYKTLKIEAPKNISYYLRKLSSDKMGLLVPGKKKGRYKISNLGIIYLS